MWSGAWNGEDNVEGKIGWWDLKWYSERMGGCGRQDQKYVYI